MQAGRQQQAGARTALQAEAGPEQSAGRQPDSSAALQAAELRRVAAAGGPLQMQADGAAQTPARAQADEVRSLAGGGEDNVQAQQEGSGEQAGPDQQKKQGEAPASGGGNAPAVDYESTLSALYTSQFGDKLGPLLLKLLKEQVSAAKLEGYAKSGVESGLKALFKLLDDKEKGTPDYEALKKQLEGGWDKLAKDTAAQIVDGVPNEVFADISKWVREHPKAVVIVAITGAVLAAIAAVLANLDPPEIGADIGLGKHADLGLKVDLGKLKEISVESAQASLGLHNDAHKYSVEAKVEKDKDSGDQTFTFGGKGDDVLLDKVEKENDERTKALKAEYHTKLDQQWGATAKLDQWKLKDLDALYRLTLDFSQKKYDSEALGALKESDVWSQAQTMFLEYTSHTDVQSGDAAHNLKIGLSLVSGQTTEKKTDGLLTRETYEQKLDQTFGATLKLSDWSPSELDLLYRASLSLSKKDFTSKEVDDLKTSTAWEKSVSLFGEVLANSTIDHGNFNLSQVNLKLGLSFLLKRDVTLERTLLDGTKVTEKKSPFELSLDASASQGYDFMSHKPDTKFQVGFTLHF